ncbi:MAG: acetyl-CoA hydrolase/transferase family protein [Bdellovibrionales bacterium]|nr:acetyl-CoA hydrolase/transferase family protein [Bdellovibrionales bacterium]
MKTLRSQEELIAQVPETGSLFLHGAAATPLPLVEELLHQSERFRNLEIIHLHTSGPGAYADPAYAGHFRVTNLFVGENMRRRLDYDRVDYLPCFLSEMPALFRRGLKRLDVALVQVSPPDSHGFCSLGTSVDAARAAVETAGLVLAQINPRMPRTHGDGVVPVERIHFAVEITAELPESRCAGADPVEARIAQQVAGLVEDGACLQMGIGAIPDAVLAALKNHRHLGVHTEMFSDGVLDLVERGAIDNSRKVSHPGKIVGSFVTGTRRLFDFVHDNSAAILLEAGYVNSVHNIARNPKAVAINSAVEVDLTGQVCADSVGSRIISGVGGQMDFIRGATISEGGKAVIALASRTKKGRPRLVAQLQPGAGVVTTRAHVHYVVTEYGVADLYGKTLGERARMLIGIAHPDDREALERAWRELIRG